MLGCLGLQLLVLALELFVLCLGEGVEIYTGFFKGKLIWLRDVVPFGNVGVFAGGWTLF